MKRVYVNEKWCLACHLCEINCAFAQTGKDDMARALKNVKINPNIRIEEKNGICFAVSCRHCENPLCVKACISGALHKEKDGAVVINKEKCVGCQSCVLVCPYGAIAPSDTGVAQKCELCLAKGGEPQCVKGCPNLAIVYEER